MGCLATLAAAPWIGFTLALLLAGVPTFLIMFKLAKISQKASHVPQQWAVYEHIQRRERAYDNSNHLLRRNMRIIQQDERQDRLLRRADRAMRSAKRA